MIRKIISLILAVTMVLSLGISVFAANSTTETVPVTLTVSNEYRELNVSVPASLPVQVINGRVITADHAEITNRSSSTSVKITDISVTEGAYSIGNYNCFSGSKTIALKINGSITEGAGTLILNDTGFPEISAGKSLKLTYYAKISGDAENTSNLEAAHVVFTIATT